jgi:hypothetical protein
MPHRAPGHSRSVAANAADRVFSPALEIDARVVDQQVDSLGAEILREVTDLTRVGHVEPVQTHRGILICQVL